MQKISLEFVESDYDIYDDTTPLAIDLKSKDTAMLMSVAVFLNVRNAWEPMTDVEWDALQTRIADILSELEK